MTDASGFGSFYKYSDLERFDGILGMGFDALSVCDFPYKVRVCALTLVCSVPLSLSAPSLLTQALTLLSPLLVHRIAISLAAWRLLSTA